MTTEIDVVTAKNKYDSGEILIDVRTAEEIKVERIPGYRWAELNTAEDALSIDSDLIKALESESSALVICRSGKRSQRAVELLEEVFPTKSFLSISEGVEGWKSAGYPLESESLLSSEERDRYSRQILLPELGIEGQERLKNSKALILGLGGLGSPVALYLAAAGVNLGFIDDDIVERSNLQRQVIHKDDRIGESKAESAAQTARELNPDIDVQVYKERLTEDNIEILGDYDLVVDGTDNFPTRYLLNDAAERWSIPVVSASILGFSGQLTVFLHSGESPCYTCLYPSPPPPELAPSCSAAGVLGVMAGTIGLLQATEAIKILANIGEPLSGKLLLYEALEADFTRLNYHRDPDCFVCGPDADPERDFPDYQEFCSIRPAIA